VTAQLLGLESIPQTRGAPFGSDVHADRPPVSGNPYPSDPATDETDAHGERDDILGRLAASDAAAWSSVVAQYQRRLTALGRAYRLTGQELEDGLQRTWLLLLTHARQVRNPECLGAWLTTTMRRECLSLLKARREDLVGDWTTYEGRSSAADGPEERLDALEERRLAHTLWALLDELPARQRDLLRALYSADEPSYAEVSACTGLPIGAIGPTRQRALRRLRELFEGSHGHVVASAY
jgi:RNA polymerase sigma factor (sigma-70 family)